MNNTELIARLRAWTIDYDGTQMVRGTTPLDGLHCDILLDAADALEAAQKKIEELKWSASYSRDMFYP